MPSRKKLENALILADSEGRQDDVDFLVNEINSLPENNKASGTLESFAQGATLSLGDELGAGVNAGIDQLGQALGVDLGQGDSGSETMSQAFSRRLDETRARQKQFSTDEPVLDIGGRLVGGIGTSGLTGGGRLLAIAAKEGGLGAIEGFGAAEDKLSSQALIDTAVSGTIGAALPASLGKIGRPGRVTKDPSRLSGRVSNEIGDVIARIEEKAGKRLATRAQEASSPAGKKIEAGLETIPFLSPTTKIKNNFFNELDKVSAESIGETLGKGKRMTTDTLLDAQDNLGAKFTDVFDKSNIAIPDNFDDKLIDIAGNHAQKIGTSTTDAALDTVTDVSERITKAVDGSAINGKELQKVRSELLTLSRDANKAGNTALKDTYNDLSSLIDDTIEKGLPADKLTAWRSTNEKWKALKALDVDGVVNAGDGGVSGLKLFRQLSKQAGGDKNVKGGIPLNDLARFAKIADVPDSGTAARQLISGGLRNILQGGAAGGAVLDPTMAATILPSIRLLGDITQKTPQKAITSILGASGRAADTSELLTVDDAGR